INAIHLGVAGTGDDFTASTLLRYFWHPEQSLAIARAFGVACAVATVGVTGLLARRLGAHGLLAAGLMAVCVIHVRQSPVAGADVPMTLMFVLALWAAVRLESAERARDYLLAGILVGLAAALKYQGALVAIAVPVVHLASRRAVVDWRSVVAAAGAMGGFLLTTPGALLDAGTFGNGFTELWAHVAPGTVAETPGWWRRTCRCRCGRRTARSAWPCAWRVSVLCCNGGARTNWVWQPPSCCTLPSLARRN
ncbi:MAG: glycosyltransferase family 39 protein, partial [bacterium]|nr:glycosyltransferase family 39 protein [bacterium]